MIAIANESVYRKGSETTRVLKTSTSPELIVDISAHVGYYTLLVVKHPDLR